MYICFRNAEFRYLHYLFVSNHLSRKASTASRCLFQVSGAIELSEPANSAEILQRLQNPVSEPHTDIYCEYLEFTKYSYYLYNILVCSLYQLPSEYSTWHGIRWNCCIDLFFASAAPLEIPIFYPVGLNFQNPLPTSYPNALCMSLGVTFSVEIQIIIIVLIYNTNS